MPWLSWRAISARQYLPGLADIARHVKGCHLSQQKRVQNALGDVAGNICQALPPPPSTPPAPAAVTPPIAQARYQTEVFDKCCSHRLFSRSPDWPRGLARVHPGTISKRGQKNQAESFGLNVHWVHYNVG